MNKIEKKKAIGEATFGLDALSTLVRLASDGMQVPRDESHRLDVDTLAMAFDWVGVQIDRYRQQIDEALP